MKVSELLKAAYERIQKGKSTFACLSMKHILSEQLQKPYYQIGEMIEAGQIQEFNEAVKLLYKYRTISEASSVVSDPFFNNRLERLNGMLKAIDLAKKKEQKVSDVLKAAKVLIENNKEEYGCHALGIVLGPKKKRWDIKYLSGVKKPLWNEARILLQQFRTTPSWRSTYFEDKQERLEGFDKAIELALKDGK